MAMCSSQFNKKSDIKGNKKAPEGAFLEKAVT